jgi:hypothetical protein
MGSQIIILQKRYRNEFTNYYPTKNFIGMGSQIIILQKTL